MVVSFLFFFMGEGVTPPPPLFAFLRDIEFIKLLKQRLLNICWIDQMCKRKVFGLIVFFDIVIALNGLVYIRQIRTAISAEWFSCLFYFHYIL
jgi:hypothetical protein